MSQMTAQQSRMLALTLLLLLLLAVGLGVYLPAKALHRHYDDAISSRNDFIQRYQRVIASGDKVRAALAQIQNGDGRSHFLTNSVAALAASEIQAVAQNLIEANGGKLISMQIGSPKDEGNIRRVTVNVQMSGNMAALRQILYTLETSRPYLIVDNLNVRSQQSSRFSRPAAPPPDLSIGFDLSGYTLIADTQ